MEEEPTNETITQRREGNDELINLLYKSTEHLQMNVRYYFNFF